MNINTLKFFPQQSFVIFIVYLSTLCILCLCANFPFLISSCGLIVHKIQLTFTHWSFKLNPCQNHLWYLVIILEDTLRFHVKDSVICKRRKFYFFLHLESIFCYYLLPNCPIHISSTMLNRSGDCGHLCLLCWL
jgi:hypothetical protein